MPTLRARQRIEAMKRVQRVAVAAFSERGFQNVRVEEIAADAGVSPISIYRWFGTKESLVFWDEYDPPLFEAISARLAVGSPLEAIRDGLMSELDEMYDSERALVLERVRLIYSEPSLLAASSAQQMEMVTGLASLFAQFDVDGSAFDHAVVASAAVAVLTACLEEWSRRAGSVGLGELIAAGFESLKESMCQP